MKYKNTVEAIYVNLDEVQNIVSQYGAEKDLQTIDIDLSLQKVREVYDLLLNLKREVGEAEHPKNEGTASMKSPGVVQNEVTQEETRVFEPELPGGTELVFETEAETKVDEKPNLEPKVQEKNVEETEQVVNAPEKTISQAEKQSRVKSKVEKKFLGDSFSREQATLNEELSGSKSASDLSSRLTTRPISNISSAIGLNEKFEIIHNLFGGDSAKYEHALSVLNVATNFNEAYNYLSENFNWDMDAPIVQRILELIRRKLIVSKNEK